MITECFTTEDLEFFQRMCRASDKWGLDWPLAVSLFPAQTEEEERWKQRTLLGILLVRGGTPETYPETKRAVQDGVT